MRIALLLILTALQAVAAPVFAQEGLPANVASSGLTQAEETELNRRLSLLQDRLDVLARQTQLQAVAVRNIAVEIFGAQPRLSFAVYTTLIENGAHELHDLLIDVRARHDVDADLSALRSQALAAAENGHLSEARALYDQLVARSNSALAARWAREDQERSQRRDADRLAVGADMAAAARLSYVAADFSDAAQRYSAAAEYVPEGRQRLEYRWEQGDALRSQGERFGDPASIQAAIAVYEDLAAPLTSHDARPDEWAQTQIKLGDALRVYGEAADEPSLHRAVEVLEGALTAETFALNPRAWGAATSDLAAALMDLAERGDEAALDRSIALLQDALPRISRSEDRGLWINASVNLGVALGMKGQSGDETALRRSADAFRAVISATSAEFDPEEWGGAQLNLGNTLSILGEHGDADAMNASNAAFESALRVYKRDQRPSDWALANMDLAINYLVLGQRGDTAALARAVALFRETLEVVTKARSPFGWARLQYNLSNALVAQGRNGDAPALQEAILGLEEVLTVRTSETDAAGWASAQTLLALALVEQAAHGDVRPLPRAIDLLNSVLSVQTKEADPAGWGASQEGLCTAYTLQGANQRRTSQARRLLQSATVACNAALSVRSREEDGAAWAETQQQIGRVLEAQGRLTGRRRLFDDAAQHYRDAEQAYAEAGTVQQQQEVSADLARVERRR